MSKTEEKQSTFTEVSPKPVIDDLPEWLGGPKVSKDQKQEPEKVDAPISQKLQSKTVETAIKIKDASTFSTAIQPLGILNFISLNYF